MTEEITFTEEILNEKLHFLCSDRIKADALNFQNVSSFPVELHAVVSTYRRIIDAETRSCVYWAALFFACF